MKTELIKNIESCKVFKLADLVETVPGSVESRTLVQNENFSFTFFGFDKGEGVSAFSVPGDTIIYLFEGRSVITVKERDNIELNPGDSVFVPANNVYSIDSKESSKLIIMLVK